MPSSSLSKMRAVPKGVLDFVTDYFSGYFKEDSTDYYNDGSSKEAESNEKDFRQKIEESGGLNMVDGFHIMMMRITNQKIIDFLLPLFNYKNYLSWPKMPELEYIKDANETKVSKFGLDYLSGFVKLARIFNSYVVLKLDTNYPLTWVIEEAGISLLLAPRVDDKY